MRILFSAIFSFLLASASFAQSLELSPDTGLITYTEVLSLEGIPADQLFSKSKSWFVQFFKNSEDVIVGENKPDIIKGVFICKYRGAMGIQTPYKNTLTVKIKDGAIKVIIDNLWTAPDGAKGMALESTVIDKDGKMKTGTTFDKFYKDVETKSHEIVMNLTAYIGKKSDW